MIEVLWPGSSVDNIDMIHLRGRSVPKYLIIRIFIPLSVPQNMQQHTDTVKHTQHEHGDASAHEENDWYVIGAHAANGRREAVELHMSPPYSCRQSR